MYCPRFNLWPDARVYNTRYITSASAKLKKKKMGGDGPIMIGSMVDPRPNGEGR